MIVFTANRYVTSSLLNNIEYIVYVNAEGYENLDTREKMLKTARVIGELNERLPRRKFILMGPGRWGSRGDIKLGVPVQYQDINNTSLLVEIARRKGGYLPELSFGTHFFQDLVESNIMYLPLYPDEGDSTFNRKMLDSSDNLLSSFVEDVEELENVVTVVRTSSLSKGGSLTIHMNGDTNDAVAYLTPPDHSKWRHEKVQQILESLDKDRFGVVSLYLCGSVNEWSAGPASDIDLIVHFRGSEDQREDLLTWLDEWSQNIDMENKDRTGYSTGGLLDVHIVTDQDIMERSSWAVHIDGMNGNATKL